MGNRAMTYQGTGVDYSALDPFKRAAQQAAAGTANLLAHHDLSEVSESRGESAYLIEFPEFFLAQVEEGLGTKNLVADAMKELTGHCYYDAIAQDTLAMIVNDLITLGALPISAAMHLAVGDSHWFDDAERVAALISGWKHACELAGCAWGGGETPTLKDVVVPRAAVFSGSANGIIKPKSRRLGPERIADGDVIVILESSGIHANGLTLAREIAAKLPQGYLTPVPGTKLTYGEALLQPTHIYAGFLDWCFNHGVELHYGVNITGHGWRKLMRAAQPFTYVISNLPVMNPLFRFIQEHGPVSDREAYGNLNMGGGFAFFMSEEAMRKIWSGLYSPPEYAVLLAGHIEKSSERKVVIQPVNLEFKGETLGVR